MTVCVWLVVSLARLVPAHRTVRPGKRHTLECRDGFSLIFSLSCRRFKVAGATERLRRYMGMYMCFCVFGSSGTVLSQRILSPSPRVQRGKSISNVCPKVWKGWTQTSPRLSISFMSRNRLTGTYNLAHSDRLLTLSKSKRQSWIGTTERIWVWVSVCVCMYVFSVCIYAVVVLREQKRNIVPSALGFIFINNLKGDITRQKGKL